MMPSHGQRLDQEPCTMQTDAELDAEAWSTEQSTERSTAAVVVADRSDIL